MSSAQSSRTRTSAPTESGPTNAPAASVGNAAEKPEHRAQEGAGAQRDGDGPGAPDPVAEPAAADVAEPAGDDHAAHDEAGEHRRVDGRERRRRDAERQQPVADPEQLPVVSGVDADRGEILPVSEDRGVETALGRPPSIGAVASQSEHQRSDEQRADAGDDDRQPPVDRIRRHRREHEREAGAEREGADVEPQRLAADRPRESVADEAHSGDVDAGDEQSRQGAEERSDDDAVRDPANARLGSAVPVAPTAITPRGE